jgi:hypothetical protein
LHAASAVNDELGLWRWEQPLLIWIKVPLAIHSTLGL